MYILFNFEFIFIIRYNKIKFVNLKRSIDRSINQL